MAGSTTRSNRPSCGTCPTTRRRSAWRSPASSRAGRPGNWPTWSSTEPQADLLSAFDRHGGTGKPRVGQVPVCYDPDRGAAVRRAHEQFRWFGGGWKVNAELPGPASLDSVTSYVREEDVAARIACGDDVDAFVEAVRPYAEAGFTEVALVRIGGDHQEAFIDRAGERLLPALRKL